MEDRSKNNNCFSDQFVSETKTAGNQYVMRPLMEELIPCEMNSQSSGNSEEFQFIPRHANEQR